MIQEMPQLEGHNCVNKSRLEWYICW